MKPGSVKQWVVIVLFCLAGAVIGGCASANVAATFPASPPHAVFSEELRNYQVLSVDDAMIGKMDDLVIGTDGAEVAYVVVRIDDIYAFGKGGGAPQDRFLLIPWSHLTLDAAQHRLIADVGATGLAVAPILSELPQPATLAWDEQIRRFWAEQ